ncbi:MAG: SpoIID/LytB domain-containing protein, partial [Bryobacteraceae bacterium]
TIALISLRVQLASALLLTAIPLIAQDIRVGVFGLFHPSILEVRSAGAILEIGGETIEDPSWHRLKAGDHVTGRAGSVTAFSLRVPGKIVRNYVGALDIEAYAGRLRAIVTMPLETAVASIVAAESEGQALETMKVQAIAVRSFLMASRGRHGAYDACDTTHCQFLREPPADDMPAARAALETSGLVITYGGQVVQAMYSAQCGGRTRTIAAAGWRVGPYPFFAVECKPCKGRPVRGHRIGLCQRGASAMSASGSGYEAILRHYFPGTSIEPLDSLPQ